MENMKEITVNVNGSGAMQLVTTHKPLKDTKVPVPAGSDVVLTSGEDGVVIITDLASETTVLEAEVVDGAVPAFAVEPEQMRVLVASEEDNTVSALSFPPTKELGQLVRRATVGIRDVACSATFIAIAEEDPDVRVLLRSQPESVIVAQGAQGAIKSVVLDPQERYLCASSEDSTVRVFALDSTLVRATEATSIPIRHADLREPDVHLRCAWQPGDATTGRLLAVPADKGIVELFERDTWKSQGRLLLPVGKSTSADTDILAFSPNGKYLVAATRAKEVFVWEVASKSVLRSFRIEYLALGVQFANSSNALVVYHSGGRLAFVKDVIPAGHTPPQHTVLSSSTTTITKSKKTKMTASTFVDDEAEVDGTRSGDENEGEQEVSFDDDNEARVEAIKASFGFGAAAHAHAHEEDALEDAGGRPSSAAPAGAFQHQLSALRTITEPFQPGSVLDPSGRSSSATSLLAWTPAGEIEVIRGANLSENLVKVEFTDKSRRGFKFNDNYMFSMAFLDDHGAVFAVPRRVREDWEDLEAGADDSSDVISSFVFYRPFDSWASNSSWHMALPEGEDAECVAAGREFCAVATSLHSLRVYTTSGLEYALLRLPGRVVTMTAKESLLAVVYQGLYGQLQFQLLRIEVDSSFERVKLVTKGELPMTPPPRDVFASHKENEQAREDLTQWSTLSWLGFDDRLVLYAVDSFACVQALSPSTAWNWFPIGCVGNALQKKPEDRHGIFTLGVVNDSLLYFPLSKGERAPRLRGNHRPVPGTFALRSASFPKTSKKTDASSNGVMWQNVRLCGLEASASETSTRGGDIAGQVVKEQAEMDKTLILMMKTACTNDEPARVLDLAKCLHLEKSHQIAQKLAIHFSLRQLQTQLYDLYRAKFEQPRQEEEAAARASSQPRRHAPVSHRDYHETEEHALEREYEREPLRRARSILSRPPSTPPRQAQQPEEEGAEEQQEEKPATSPEITSSKSVGRSKVAARAVRSVAPVNPFLKKPAGDSTTSPSASTTDRQAAKKSGLQRLSKFTSPPAKKRRSTWK